MSQSDFVRRMGSGGSAIYCGPSQWRRLHVDIPLLSLLLVLAAAGLFVLYSASGQNIAYVHRQLVHYGIGLLVMLTVAQIPLRLLDRWAIFPYFLGVLLLIAVLFFGVGAKGAQRWLEIGGFRFQPSEILKIAVPLMLASYLGKRAVPPQFKHVFFALVFILVPLVLVGMQPDLGTAILIGAAGFFALFLAGLPRRYLMVALLLAACLLPLMWFHLLYDYQRQRILTLFNPEADRLGAGWNIIQSTIAIGSGGVDGKGWTLGTQSQLDFLPEGHTDFIIAVLAEEFGLFGVMLLLALYLLIISRCAFIGLRAQSMFGRLLAGSIALTFFVYIFVNMGMVSGILPVVGVPLPLVSYGGTSIVTLMLGFGMLMAVSTERKRSV
ncbi:MAG: rod shape-determining protein RodA [Porticoccus sp.]|jgi:rod shape determining protein RodA|uniref:rod shape-determining protein RodA n=1 Tax=Porticoccus hydrocarbonoclasticus TaxID=1073414 RepID=UPI00056BAD99|nr:rod shape-determining protein RodA [Porticoccus hydrocarbonoclasticus]MBG58346.1 rod shape-determining protein RodA [Porticoccus sp.]